MAGKGKLGLVDIAQSRIAASLWKNLSSRKTREIAGIVTPSPCFNRSSTFVATVIALERRGLDAHEV